MSTLRYGLFKKEISVKINTLSNSYNVYQSSFKYKGLGFPLTVGKDEYVLLRFGKILEKDIVPAVLNGYEIDLASRADEVIIEDPK